jgi:methanogenesis imperfect marker protein 11
MSKSELIRRYGDIPWISPYERIIAMTDGEYIELHEFHARNKCSGGAAWEVYHYPRVSNLVLGARREGSRNIFVVRTGRAELNLIPGVAGAGMEMAEINGENIEITYAGLAGGGIAATVCRGMAEGVKGIEIIQEGGGGKLGKAKLVVPAMKKVVIGVDDTDTKESGATWSLVNEIAYKLEKDGLGIYLLHTITQLYLDNPYKTTNCVSISVTFATQDVEALVDEFGSMLEERTLSEDTAMAVSTQITIDEELREYGKLAKMEMLDVNYARDVAERNDIELIAVTGERGIIGALAAISFSDSPDDAVKIP